MGNPHVLVIPYPAQGHVIPLLELAQCLVKHGFKVTFVNTDFNHERVVNALSSDDNIRDRIRLVSIPDGMESCEDRINFLKIERAIHRVIPEKLEELIGKINGSKEDDEISCIIADALMVGALEVAKNMGIQRAAFFPMATAILALILNIPKLLDDEIINHNGTPTKNQMIQLSATMIAMNTKNFPWAFIDDLATQKFIFDLFARSNKVMEIASWLICNSTHQLEPAAFECLPCPNIMLSIGPLLVSNGLGNSAGNFWPEDSTCLQWLDQQLPKSVIYVAFGSFTIFDQNQFRELALGLELTDRPFLWVVRPDLTEEAQNAYPDGFKERVAARGGRMVGWAPQKKVLAHPSVACFLSHCGWNSTMEGIGNGIPFLCWPYYADQFFNKTYICDVWKVGLGLNPDENGIIMRKEIKDKVEQLLGDDEFKARALDMKKLTAESIKDGNCSYNNFNKLMEWIKA